MVQDEIPKNFWAKWFKFYKNGDTLACHALIETSLIGKDGGPRIGMATLANSYFEDLTDYLVGYMQEELRKCNMKNNSAGSPKSKR